MIIKIFQSSSLLKLKKVSEHKPLEIKMLFKFCLDGQVLNSLNKKVLNQQVYFKKNTSPFFFLFKRFTPRWLPWLNPGIVLVSVVWKLPRTLPLLKLSKFYNLLWNTESKPHIHSHLCSRRPAPPRESSFSFYSWLSRNAKHSLVGDSGQACQPGSQNVLWAEATARSLPRRLPSLRDRRSLN